MGRLIQILIPIVLLTTAIAGCLGGDGDPDPPTNGGNDDNGDNGNGNMTDDNVTQDPPPKPVANIAVQMAIGDNASADPPFIAKPGDTLTFTLEGGGSTVENGTIDVYSWTVVRPNGNEIQTTTGDASTFEFGVNGTSNPTDYGVYTATLRVMTDQLELDTTTIQFALSYRNSFGFNHDYLLGPATDCEGYQSSAEGDLLGSGVVHGTYGKHSVKVGVNATTMIVGLNFTTEDQNTEMKLYVYDPETDIEDTNCGDAIQESETTGDSTSLTVNGLSVSQAVTYNIRAQMIGAMLTGYTLDIEVLYEVPGDAGDDEGDDGDE